MRGKHCLAGVILALALVPMLACSGQAPPATSAAPTAAPPLPAAQAAAAAAPADSRPSAAPAYQPTPLSPPMTLRVGLVGGTSDAGVFIAIEKGYFEQEGLHVETEIVPSTAVMVGAL